METKDNDFKRIEAHPEPKELPAYDGTDDKIAAASAPVVSVAENTADVDEVRGGSFGWAALAGVVVALVVAGIAYFSGVWRTPALTAPETAVISSVGILPTQKSTEATQTATAPTQTVAADQVAAVYLFGLDGSTVAENAELNAVAKKAIETGDEVEIDGYTDESGRLAYNQRLSADRAKAVADYLVAHGVPAGHIHTKGCGPTHAYASAQLDRRANVYLR